MGTFRTSSEIRKMFVTPMSEMIAEMMRLCDDWDSAVERGDIAVPDMLLNDTMAHNSLGTIKKFIRELQGKIDDSKLGVYRHRANEWQNRTKGTSGNKKEKNRQTPPETASSSASPCSEKARLVPPNTIQTRESIDEQTDE